MQINPTAPVNPDWVKQAVELYHAMPDLAKGDDIYFDHVPMHWEVGEYGQTCGEYNLMTYLDPATNKWLYKITHDPRDNARTIIDPPMQYAAHTLRRNSHGIGCSVAAMWNATPSDFGQWPIQEHEAEAFFAMVGAACAKYNLDGLDSNQCYTHAEAAIIDDYFGERWDWARTEPSNEPLTVDEANLTAHLMRQRVHLYKAAILAALAG